MSRSLLPSLPILVLLLGPLHADPVPLPETQGWVEVRTEHFEVFGNASPKQTKKIALDLERFREVLGRITKGFDFSADVPTSVYVFKSDRDLEPFKLDDSGKPLNLAGYFMERPLRKYTAIDASAGYTPLHTIQHEYVHSLLHQTFGSLPLWLNEGLAEYYSTFRFRDSSNTAEVGHPIEGHVQHLGRHGLIEIADLFGTTHDSATYNEGTRQGSFYAQSWLLVHYLVATDERREQFGNFLARLWEGADGQEALAATLGVDAAALQERLAKYLHEGSNYYWFTLDEDVSQADAAPRAMAPREVLFRLGDLLAHRSPTDAEAATRLLTAALEPDSPQAEILGSLGVAAERSGREEEAEAWYRKAAAASASDPVHLTRLAKWVLHRHLAADPAIPEGTTVPEPVLEARGLYRRSLALNAKSVEAMAGLGRTFLFGEDDPELGLRVLAGAATVSPFRTDILHDFVALLAKAGRREAAWTVLEQDLRPKAKDPDLVRSAAHWAVGAELEAARERFEGGDRQAALDVLAQAERRTDDPRQLERLDEARTLMGRIERYHEAVDLANAGKFDEAEAAIAATLDGCSPAELCAQVRETAAQMRSTIDRQRAIGRYEEAVALLRAGKLEAAVEILRALAVPSGDPEVSTRARTILDGLERASAP